MGDKSKIEWTEATWNPVVGCSKVSPGCDHCYAETLARRYGWTPKPWTVENAADNVILKPERLDQPIRWRRPRMVFVNSMSDLFHELVPDEYVASVFATMALAQHHTFQVLTKRPKRALELLSRWQEDAAEMEIAGAVPLPNVWIGTSIESWRFNWRADVLRRIPAAVRFISAEPLLDTLMPERNPDRRLALTGIDWVIVGGESGHGARPMHPDWARELRDACHEDGVAFFFKQWGSWAPGDGDSSGSYLTGNRRSQRTEYLDRAGAFRDTNELSDFRLPDGWEKMHLAGVSPKAGGRELDGREWSDMPERQAVPA